MHFGFTPYVPLVLDADAKRDQSHQKCLNLSVASCVYRTARPQPQDVEPTEYGRALLDGGAAVFDDLCQAVKKIEFVADPCGRGSTHRKQRLVAASFVSDLVDRLSRIPAMPKGDRSFMAIASAPA